jgi:hypothetical protein
MRVAQEQKRLRQEQEQQQVEIIANTKGEWELERKRERREKRMIMKFYRWLFGYSYQWEGFGRGLCIVLFAVSWYFIVIPGTMVSVYWLIEPRLNEFFWKEDTKDLVFGFIGFVVFGFTFSIGSKTETWIRRKWNCP